MPASVPIRPRDLLREVDKLKTKRYPGAIVAFNYEGPWDGDHTELHTAAGEAVQVRVCRTPLAVRHAIATAADVPWTFILTPLQNEDLPLDVRGRLVPYGRVSQPNATTALASVFAAATVLRSTVADRSDIPALLDYLGRLENTGVFFEPAERGVLTREHLNTQLAVHGLGLDHHPTLKELARWSVTADALSRWQQLSTGLPERVFRSFIEWLTVQLGVDAARAVQYLSQSGPRELVPFGLAAEVLRPTATWDATRLSAATGYFRSATNISQPTSRELAAWAEAAVAVYQEPDSPAWGLLPAAETLIARMDDQLAIRSSVCRRGFEARIAQVAEVLDTDRVYAALDFAAEHVLAAGDDSDLAVARSAVRLKQWLASPEATPPSDLAEWLVNYRRELAFVDECINRAWRGGTVPELAAAARRLVDQARNRRRDLDRDFAGLAGKTGARRATAGDTLLVEDVLDRIIEPVRKHGPVLLAVLDGMSVAAASALLDSVRATFRGSWVEAVPGDEQLRTALAAYPTVTEFSRASLFTGKPARGGQNEESKGLTHRFPDSHLLFKDDLSDVARTTKMVEDTTRYPLLAAVFNTIDDALDKSDPLDRRWEVQHITHLASVLQAAGRVGRTVVFVSDHGHIVERNETPPTPGGTGSARWRAGADPAEYEVAVTGDRVLSDSGEAILAVDENVRYTSRKAGYHGGLSLAEACIPVAILTQNVQAFTAPDAALPCFLPRPGDLEPVWWRIGAPATPVVPVTTGTEQPDLFSEAPAASTSHPLATVDFFRERVEQNSKALGHGPEEVAALVSDAITNQGRISRAVLRERWGLSPIALNGVVPALVRTLNFDGVEVLTQEGQDLVVNEELLNEQFGLKG